MTDEPEIDIEIDRDFCVSAGHCLQYAPGAFKWDEQEISTLDDPSKATDDQLKLAERNCPGGAIRILRLRENGPTAEGA